ncbi:MAG: PQQ-dependent sugar dehydrogenase [Betaproteobacteria bacterium]|nr:PQQ-dependent sugar dehydrogenase [Betaproteobacteria bacterium]
MATLSPRSNRISLIALLLVLTACGGGGGGGGSDVATGSSALSGPTTGSLALSITGLPDGVNGAVAVSGPGGFNQAVSATQVLADLTPGTYTIAGADVLSGSAVFAPQPSTQALAVGAGATADASVIYASAGALSLALQEVVSGLAAPLFLTAPAGDPRLFIVEQAGTIRIVQNGAVLATPFLDISARVSAGGERGLLSMAFDPQYASNGFFFVYFTDLNGDIAIERFQVSSGDPNLADPAPLRILTIAHRDFANHNGGLVEFGPDGFLYAGTGDGGGGGDTLGNGQNLNALLGKLLRIDVSNASAVQPYAIPPLNPFVGQANRRGEIWAYGLRNPWRYAFDTATGLLYIADVGQGAREEVNVAAAATAGLNYGWNITEGSLCFPGDPCDRQGLTLPVLEYAHDATGGCSITGGRVYRGSAIPELRGRYFYSDFCSGWLRSFVYSNGAAAEQVDWNIINVGQIFSFGEDAQKELYMLTSTGSAYKIVRQ